MPGLRCGFRATVVLLAAAGMAFGGEAARDAWAEAARNAAQANEAFARCERLVRAWYEHRGTGNYLLPQNLRSRLWTPHNSAADLWPFFVITAYLTDQAALDTSVRQTLADEIRLTTRVGNLPDDYDIDRNVFAHREAELPRMIFASSEYVKDGLLPVVELMGRTVWFDRIRGIVGDICVRAPVATAFGNIPSESAEVNGNMLQTLCRLYAATGDPRYKAWVERIGDAYFLEMLPRNNDLPCHAWDFAAGKPRSDLLSLCDHGNEVIFGLSELVALEHVHDPPKAKQYIPAMRRMLDKLLSVAVNEDGLWYYSIRPSTGEVVNRATPDTWGYAFDAVYTFYLVTGEVKYRDAVHRALRGVNAKEQYARWEGSDSYADSIEGGIVLLNRIPEPEGFAWLEKLVPVFLAKQREDGIVEGWHGDGNYARTALMYALMKTAGTRVRDWRVDLEFGASVNGDVLQVHLSAEKPWQGTLHFDYPRHRMHMGLPVNYPRLNEFPEWYTVEPTRLYSVAVDGKSTPAMLGDDLIRGLRLEVGKQPVRVVVRPVAGPPYGGRGIRIEAPATHAADGPFHLRVVVRNETGQPAELRLKTSFGRVEPAQASVPVGGSVEAALTGELSRNVEAKIEAEAQGETTAACTIRLVHGRGIVGFIAFDDEQYEGTLYRWCGREPIEFSLPARRGQPHTLHLLWGAKGDRRAATVIVGGREYKVARGGYNGFEWVTVQIEAAGVTGDALSTRIAPDLPGGKPAFVSEAKLTSP